MGIRLSDRTRENIAERHPEVKPYIAFIAETVSEPDVVSKGESYYNSLLHIGCSKGQG